MRFRTGKISTDFSFTIETEKTHTVNVTLSAYGKDYTQTVSSDSAANKWIAQQIEKLKK